MESLFADTGDEAASRPAGQHRRAEKEDADKTSSGGGKDFSADLQAFLQEAFDESFEEQQRAEDSRKTPRRPLTGLDALIRNTLEPASMTLDPQATRRLVVTFREAQLEKLRTIAKMEKTYLKKIINDIVEEFIAGYEKKEER